MGTGGKFFHQLPSLGAKEVKWSPWPIFRALAGLAVIVLFSWTEETQKLNHILVDHERDRFRRGALLCPHMYYIRVFAEQRTPVLGLLT